MKATIDMPTLKKALANVKPALPKKGWALPVLQGAHLEAVDGELRITVTDLDISARTSVPAEVSVPGKIVLPYARLSELVKKGKGQLALELGDEEVKAINGATSTIRVLPVEEYPNVPAFSNEPKEHVIDLPALRAALLAVSKDNALPVISSVFFDGNRIVSTDRYRLHITEVPGANYPKVLVPERGLRAIAKQKEPATFQVSEDGQRIEVDNGAVRWTIRLTEGEFPPYNQLRPTFADLPYRAEVDKQVLLDAAQHVKGVIPGYDSVTPLRLHIRPSEIEIEAIVQDIGQSSMVVPAVTHEVEGAGLTVGVNPTYFLDVVAAGPGEKVDIRLIDHLKPINLEESDDEGRVFTRILMPVRL